MSQGQFPSPSFKSIGQMLSCAHETLPSVVPQSTVVPLHRVFPRLPLACSHI